MTHLEHLRRTENGHVSYPRMPGAWESGANLADPLEPVPRFRWRFQRRTPCLAGRRSRVLEQSCGRSGRSGRFSARAGVRRGQGRDWAGSMGWGPCPRGCSRGEVVVALAGPIEGAVEGSGGKGQNAAAAGGESPAAAALRGGRETSARWVHNAIGWTTRAPDAGCQGGLCLARPDQFEKNKKIAQPEEGFLTGWATCFLSDLAHYPCLGTKNGDIWPYPLTYAPF